MKITPQSSIQFRGGMCNTTIAMNTILHAPMSQRDTLHSPTGENVLMLYLPRCCLYGIPIEII